MMEADGSTSNKLPQPPALSDQVLQRRRTSSAATDAEEAMLAHMADLNHVESR